MVLAIEALSWIELRKINEQAAMRRTVNQLGIVDEDVMEKGYNLVFEVTRRLNALDYLIGDALKPKQIDECIIGVRSFLRLYTYAIKYGNIDFEEAMKMADIGREVLGEEINSVEYALHIIPNIELDFQIEDRFEQLALTTFHPTWFVRYCMRTFGEKETQKILRSGDPPTYVRVNTLKTTPEDLLEALKRENVSIEKELKGIYRLVESEQHLPELEPYKEGLFITQDKASAYAVEAASPKPGWTVLDVCAAPGIKTSHMAQLMKNSGEIYSMDYSKRRMASWSRLTRRMGVENAKPILGDAKRRKDFPEVMADLVLVDPPCTGTGTFWRVPSAKWRINETSISTMADIQWKILSNSASHVKKGGHLLYSTCSITTEENEELINKLLDVNPSFKPIKLEPDLGTPGLKGQKEARRLYPHTDNCNGFFISKLRREL